MVETFRERLEAMVEEDQQTWDLSTLDVEAIAWALVQIENLLAACEEMPNWLDDDGLDESCWTDGYRAFRRRLAAATASARAAGGEGV